MKLSDFDFTLPEELIATRPAQPRSASRLLVAQGDKTLHTTFHDLPDFLRAGDVLVLNDTKVIPARLNGLRTRISPDGVETHSKIEATLLAPSADGQTWGAMIKPLKKVKDGERIDFGAGLSAVLENRAEGTAVLRFNLLGDAFDAALGQAGLMPLPPYIASKRPADAQDQIDHQTIWARQTGAVAAPTASLHFDQDVMTKLAQKGVQFAYITLHVGAGTFLPVKTDDIEAHKMHSERGVMTADAARAINQARADGGRVIAVGTTALRLIESAADAGGTLGPWNGSTDIFIRPGYSFKLTDGLITNFHLPKSTLLMLVSALIGMDRMKQIYADAIAHQYRFFSYGDASLLLPDA